MPTAPTGPTEPEPTEVAASSTTAENEDVAQVLAVLSGSEPRCGKVRVVAIDGPSGSGKTVLAEALAVVLGCQVVHVDDVIPGWDGLPLAAELLTEQILRPLSRNEPASYRRWDWHSGAWNHIEEVPAAATLIIEGCSSSVRPAGNYAAVRVWMDADPEVRMARGIARDGEVYRPYWQRWAAQESALFQADDTASRADIVIDTTGR